MTIDTTKTSTDPTRKPSRKFTVIAVICLVVLVVGVRVAVVLPMLNYYHYRDDSKWTIIPGFASRIKEPAKVAWDSPGYSFKNSGPEFKYFPPAGTLAQSLMFALMHQPDQGSLDPLAYDTPNSPIKFLNANGTIAPRPSVSDMPLYVMRGDMYVLYLRKRDREPSIKGDSVGGSIVYQRLTDTKATNIVEKETIVHITPGSLFGKDGGDQCLWDSSSKSSIVDYNACWSDRHSTFYAKNGNREYFVSNDTMGDYKMTPHLTLLYDRRTGQLAGGYWWGEFHSEG